MSLYSKKFNPFFIGYQTIISFYNFCNIIFNASVKIQPLFWKHLIFIYIKQCRSLRIMYQHNTIFRAHAKRCVSNWWNSISHILIMRLCAIFKTFTERLSRLPLASCQCMIASLLQTNLTFGIYLAYSAKSINKHYHLQVYTTSL